MDSFNKGAIFTYQFLKVICGIIVFEGSFNSFISVSNRNYIKPWQMLQGQTDHKKVKELSQLNKSF